MSPSRTHSRITIVRPNRAGRIRILSAAITASALVIGLLAPGSQPAAAAENDRSVSGVVSLPAGAPAEWLSAVQVSAQPVSGPGYRSVWVDPVTGTYSLTDLAPGSYRIQFSVNQVWDGSGFSRPNLVSEYYDDTTDWNSATVVDVSEDSASSIDAQLATGRTISGRVTLPEGADPAWLSAISVNASAPTSGSGYTQVDPATGAYSITGLAPGAYQVQFTVGTFWDGSTSVKPNLVSEYYDDTNDWTTASPVDVSTGDKSGIDAALEQGRSITGTVSLPAGAPPEWLNSVSVSASAVNGSMVGGLTARPDSTTGEYTLTGLAPGAYQVAFRVMTVMPGAELPNLVDEYYDNAYTPSAAAPVDVTDADESGINATLESGRSISGTVSLPADAPAEWIQAASVSLMTPDGDYLSYRNNVQIDTATGAYTLSRLPAGDFIVYFSASSYYDGTNWTYPDIAPEYYDDAATRDDATIVSTTGGNATGIDAALGHGAGIDLDLDASALLGTGNGIGISITDLDGNVLTSYGDPLPEDGHYPITMSNLTPGGYRIAVTTTSWDEQTSTSTLESAQFLRFGSATSIQLAAGHTETGQVTARAADATISGNIRAEGFATAGNVLGSALPYEKLDGNWTRIPEVHFDTAQNGDTPYSLALPSGTYTIGYEADYSPATTPVQEQWWNGKNTLAAADPITLTTGQTRTDINGTIHPSRTTPEPPSGAVDRLAGGLRFDTAVAISQDTFDENVPVVYIANAYNFPDALSGAAAAGVKNGPVLLTPADSIPDVVKAELARLKPQRIVVLGGPNAINDTVRQQLDAFTSGAVDRLAGGLRFDTAVAISQDTFDENVPVVYIANAYNFPDALSGAAAAGVKNGPVLLTPADSIPDVVKAELARLKPQRIVVLGGPNAINDTVRQQLDAFTSGAVDRLAGGLRFDTAVAISQDTFDENVPVVYIANAYNFPDALSGAAAAGVKNGPVLLTPADSIPDVVKAELARLKPQRIVVLGGPNAINAGVVAALTEYVPSTD